MSQPVLAHLNVVKPTGRLSLDEPEPQYFFTQLQKILQVTKTTPGLKWHTHGIRTAEGGYLDFQSAFALGTEGETNPHVLTMAGWESPRALHQFAYRLRLHMDGMKRLRNWVDRSEGATMVMWWAPAGQRVSLEAGWARLTALRANGPTPGAFTLQTRFDPPADLASSALGNAAAATPRA